MQVEAQASAHLWKRDPLFIIRLQHILDATIRGRGRTSGKLDGTAARSHLCALKSQKSCTNPTGVISPIRILDNYSNFSFSLSLSNLATKNSPGSSVKFPSKPEAMNPEIQLVGFPCETFSNWRHVLIYKGPLQEKV